LAENPLAEPLSSAVSRIQNEILLTVIAIAIVLAVVAIAGQLTFLSAITIILVFIIGLSIYDAQKRKSREYPPGSIEAKAASPAVAPISSPEDVLRWTFVKEVSLPDPIRLIFIKPSLEMIGFEIPFEISTKQSKWIYVYIRSHFQSVIFVLDHPIRVWRWKSLRYQEISASLDDSRIMKTADGDVTYPIEFHAKYRLKFAIKETTIRSKLAITYRIWASDNGKQWWDVSGPCTLYAKMVEDEKQIREILGETPTT
jgi:hypothetical protein